MNQRGLATLPVISTNSGEVELATELAMRPHRCSLRERSDVEVEDVKVELWVDCLGRRRGGLAGRARRGDGGAKLEALVEWMSRLRHGVAPWRLEGIVQADRWDRRRRTVDTWPDTRRRTASVQN